MSYELCDHVNVYEDKNVILNLKSIIILFMALLQLLNILQTLLEHFLAVLFTLGPKIKHQFIMRSNSINI